MASSHPIRSCGGRRAAIDPGAATGPVVGCPIGSSRSNRALALGFTLLWVACRSKPEVASDVTLPPEEAVRELLGRASRAIAAGEAEQLVPLFAADALVLGLGRRDVWTGEAAIAKGVQQALLPVADSQYALKIEDSHVVVGLAEGQEAAWAFDSPRVTVTHDGKTEVWLPRLTAHLIKEGTRWRIDALHLSLPINTRALPTPEMLVAVGQEKAGSSEGLVEVVRESIADRAGEIKHLSETPEGVQVDWATFFVGGKAWRDLLIRVDDGKPLEYQKTLEDNLRVKRAPGGRSGWVAAQVTLERKTSPQFGRGVGPISTRGLWTLVEEGGGWKISSAHLSFAQGEGQGPATEQDVRNWQQKLAEAERSLAQSRAAAMSSAVPESPQ